MTPFEFLHPAEQIVAIMNRIYENGMTTTSGGMQVFERCHGGSGSMFEFKKMKVSRRRVVFL